jgi:hypothetical protein
MTAQSLGHGFQALSISIESYFSGCPVEQAVQDLLTAPESMEIPFGVRLGHPITSGPPGSYLRVHPDVGDFVHHSRFDNTGPDA